jgi:hypothetical protein
VISIRRITLVVLALAVAVGVVTEAAAAKTDPVAVASKKCKKKKGAKKKKKCKRSTAPSGESTLPGQPAHPTTTPPPGTGSVAPLAVVDLVLADDTVLQETSTQATVTLDSPAPSGGQPVALQSSNPSRIVVPSGVHVAEDQTSASFAVDTTTGGTTTGTISATLGVSTQDAQLRVVSEPSVESVTLAYKCFPDPGLAGLVTVGNRVSLDVPAPADTVVGLSSDSASLAVPPSVTVPSGARSALFAVDTSRPADPSVTVTATLGTSSASATPSPSVRDDTSPQPSIIALSLSPTSVFLGGTSTGTVTLGCEAPAAGSSIALTSDVPNITFAVPGDASATSVIVPEDALSADFTIETNDAPNGPATIRGTDSQAGFREATLSISDLGT